MIDCACGSPDEAGKVHTQFLCLTYTKHTTSLASAQLDALNREIEASFWAGDR